jgi:hypothetical protein
MLYWASSHTTSWGVSLRPTVVAVLLLVTSAFAQQPANSPPRIIDFTQVDVYARYRYVDTTSGAVTSDDLQYRISGRIRLNLHNTGTYVGSRIETGSTFASGWSNSGVGRSKAEWVLNAKTFFVGQKLGKNAEVEVGAMDFEQGAGSEASYADFDSYTEGYRLRVHDLRGRYAPSKLVLHIGYVGDLNTVNSFARMHRLGEINYVQVLAEKSLNKKATASLQYDRLRGFNLLRAATKMTLPDPWWVNDARLETVARVSDGATAGWALHLVKTKNRMGKFNPGMYYSHIPTGVFRAGQEQALINGDVYGLGKRLGLTSKYQVTKAFDIAALITRRLDTVQGFRWRAQIVGHYQLAPLLKWLP